MAGSKSEIILYSEVPNRRACSLRFFRFSFHPACNFSCNKQKILPCLFINLLSKFLLGTSEYFNWILKAWFGKLSWDSAARRNFTGLRRRSRLRRAQLKLFCQAELFDLLKSVLLNESWKFECYNGSHLIHYNGSAVKESRSLHSLRLARQTTWKNHLQIYKSQQHQRLSKPLKERPKKNSMLGYQQRIPPLWTVPLTMKFPTAQDRHKNLEKPHPVHPSTTRSTAPWHRIVVQTILPDGIHQYPQRNNQWAFKHPTKG